METPNIERIKPIVFRTCSGFIFYDYDEIVVISANGNSSIVFTLNSSNSIKILHTISFIHSKYGRGSLFRCHKSHIINTKYIDSLIRKNHHVIMKNDYVVPLSPEAYAKVMHLSLARTSYSCTATDGDGKQITKEKKR